MRMFDVKIQVIVKVMLQWTIRNKDFKRNKIDNKLLHETTWAKFMFLRCMFLKLIQKIAKKIVRTLTLR